MRPECALATSLLILVFGGTCGRGAPPPPSAEPATRRLLPQGEIVGSVGRFGNHVWRGLPFAQPPVGELRWRAPLPAGDWEGTREALEDAPTCPQFPESFGGGDPDRVAGEEDCLYLNVFAPAFAPGELPRGSARLPVMVWIHGGGNTRGTAATYDGGRLAQEQRVIVVAVQYRLGPLGWLRHAALRGLEASDEDASGNFGTLDLIEALRWVHRSVSAFGGDSGRVTIFGESAGGRNVLSLLLSPLAHGLFQRAISQSGALELLEPARAENAADAAEPGHASSSAELVARLLVAAGRAPDRSAALARAGEMDADALAAFLRAQGAEPLVRASRAAPGAQPGDYPQTFADGVVLPADPPLAVLAAGRYSRVPVILGSNRDEWKLFLAYDPDYVERRFGFVRHVRDWERYERDAGYRSDLWKLDAVDAPATVMRGVQGPSVFAYRFDWDDLPRRPWFDAKRMIGAAHALDLPFTFGVFWPEFLGVPLDAGRIDERDALSAALRSYWAQFAYSGAPGRGRDGVLPEWSPWPDGDELVPRLMLLDSAADGGVRMSADHVTSAGLAARLAADPRFASAAERCAKLEELARWRPEFSPADRTVAGCAGSGD